jgi:hypothetical protein
MSKNSELAKLMREPLPSIGYQRRLSYRTNEQEVIDLYKIINRDCFNNKLNIPEIEIMGRCRKYWGMCYGSFEIIKYRKTYCKIRLMDKWFCKQWLITTLAHEMVHQYQWDIDGDKRESEGKNRIMSHGPSFYAHRERLAKHDISLKQGHGRKRWFKHQRFDKC